MISLIEVRLPKKPPAPKNIGEGLKGLKRKLWKEALLVKYYKNKDVRLLPDTIPIQSFPEGTKFIHSFVAPSIKSCDCSDA